MDDKPQSVHTCTAEECTPINNTSPQWDAFHMPCWCCNRDDNHHDLMWHEESEMFFHKVCLLKRARDLAFKIATAPNAPLNTCIQLNFTGTMLRHHKQQLEMRKV